MGDNHEPDEAIPSSIWGVIRKGITNVTSVFIGCLLAAALFVLGAPPKGLIPAPVRIAAISLLAAAVAAVAGTFGWICIDFIIDDLASRRRKARQRDGRCLKCGHDLQGTPGIRCLSCGEMNMELLLKQRPMLPPWLVFQIPRVSIGWRMDPGEYYLDHWHEWLLGLSEDEAAKYVEQFAEPDEWENYYAGLFASARRRGK